MSDREFLAETDNTDKIKILERIPEEKLLGRAIWVVIAVILTSRTPEIQPEPDRASDRPPNPPSAPSRFATVLAFGYGFPFAAWKTRRPGRPQPIIH